MSLCGDRGVGWSPGCPSFAVQRRTVTIERCLVTSGGLYTREVGCTVLLATPSSGAPAHITTGTEVYQHYEYREVSLRLGHTEQQLLSTFNLYY